MLLVVDIPDIPYKEGLKALDYLKSKYKVSSYYLWKDGFALVFAKEKIKVKGPKVGSQVIDMFKNKMNKMTYTSDVMFLVFYDFNGYVYCEYYTKLDPILMLKEIPWIRPIRILGDTCTRPVKAISVSNLEEYMTSEYCGIKPKEKFKTEEDFLDFYRKEEIILSLVEKRNKVSALMSGVTKINNLDFILHTVSNPNVVSLPLDERYVFLPSKIVEYVISKELFVFPKYNYSILESFYFIVDKKNNFSYNLDSLLLSMNSRLEDLMISYERDINLVTFVEDKGGLKGYDRGLRGKGKEEKTRFQEMVFSIVNHMNFKHLKKNFLLFLIENYKNDYNTTLVEEYPELLGLLSYYVYENHPDYNRYIHEALLSYSGEIKNEYGFVMYLGDKLCLLTELGNKKQLATSTKDPFGTKVIVDKIIELLLVYKKNLMNVSKDLKELFNKRIKLYFQNKNSNIANKIKQIHENNVLESLLDINEIFIFLEKNYDRLQIVMKKLAFTENIHNIKTEQKLDFFKNNNNLSIQLQFVENILGNTNIINSVQYLCILKYFYLYITSIVDVI